MFIVEFSFNFYCGGSTRKHFSRLFSNFRCFCLVSHFRSRVRPSEGGFFFCPHLLKVVGQVETLKVQYLIECAEISTPAGPPFSFPKRPGVVFPTSRMHQQPTQTRDQPIGRCTGTFPFLVVSTVQVCSEWNDLPCPIIKSGVAEGPLGLNLQCV